MTALHTHSFVVPNSAIDALGHVNNQVYIGWMQDLAVAHSAARGWPMERYLASGGVWVVRSHRIDYLRAAKAGETIRAETWVADMTPRGSQRAYRFYRVADGKLLVRASTLWVYIDLKSGRPLRLSEELRRSFELLTRDDDDTSGTKDRA